MLSWMKELMSGFLDMVYSLLPLSPFAEFISSLENLPYISYLNWFVPVGRFVTIAGAWLAAIFLWYFYGLVLRWIKAIE